MPKRFFIVHQSLTGLIREDTLDGRPYLVAPVVAVKAGVLNGELLLPEELSHSLESWNNVPLVLNHPADSQGVPISANSKAVLESAAFGVMLNSRFVDNGITAELWIDLVKAAQLGGLAIQCVERLRARQPLEVSTGYWRDPEMKSGTFNGVAYQGIQRHLRPDHLALLPNDTGACSWKDGCGAPRVNVSCTCQPSPAAEPLPQKKTWLNTLTKLLSRPRRVEQPATNIEQSADDIEDALWQALTEEVQDPGSFVCIEDYYPDTQTVVYCVGSYDMGMEGPLYRRAYTLDPNGMAVLGDSVTEVVEETRYLPVTNPPAMNVQDEEPDPSLSYNVASSARTPNYNGTETTSWGSVDKSLGAYATACTHAQGAECPTSVAAMTSSQKEWIASKSLLGDSGATTAHDLIFFPVVNPRTGKLNEGALHAVVSGRGSQAKIDDSAKTSAQNKARALLAKEFNAETTATNQQQQGDDMDKKAKVAAIIVANKMDPAAEPALLLLNDEQLDKLVPPPEAAPAALAINTAAPVVEPAPVAAPSSEPSQAAKDAAYVMNMFAQQAQQQRAQLTEFIVANSAYTAELLAVKSLEELQILVQMAAPVVNYAARGFGPRGQQEAPKTGAPEIQSPYKVGEGWVHNGVKIAGTPTFE